MTNVIRPWRAWAVAAGIALLAAGWLGTVAVVGQRERPVTRPATSAYLPPKPPAEAERQRDRLAMVRNQIEHPHDGRRPLRNDRVLAAMRQVPRHAFVPEGLAAQAYADTPLPIGDGQTISQPYVVALMTELLELEPGEKVLEIGTGSGYQAAVLAALTDRVYTIEIVQSLARRANAAVEAQRYADVVSSRCADGYWGWPEEAPFDAIIVTCAAGHVPGPLWEQLKPGGKMVIPIGGPFEVQRLVVITKTDDGKRKSRTVIPVAFVPMTGEAQKK